MDEFLWWSGVVAWAALGLIGILCLLDWVLGNASHRILHGLRGRTPVWPHADAAMV